MHYDPDAFRDASVEDLLLSFNQNVGNNGWTSARAEHDVAVHEALRATGLDCSDFMNANGDVSSWGHVVRDGGRLVAKAKYPGPRCVCIREEGKVCPTCGWAWPPGGWSRRRSTSGPAAGSVPGRERELLPLVQAPSGKLWCHARRPRAIHTRIE
jgi:hypothetical protein